MKICTNCGKPKHVIDAYAPPKIFCDYCGSAEDKEIEAIQFNPVLKHVKRYCEGCGSIISDTGYNNNNTICPLCYGNIKTNQ